MIISLFLTVSAYFFNFISWMLPDWILPSRIITTWEGLIVYFNIFNGFFPLATAFNCFLIILAFEIAIIISRMLFGLISLIRGGGSVDI